METKTQKPVEASDAANLLRALQAAPEPGGSLAARLKDAGAPADVLAWAWKQDAKAGLHAIREANEQMGAALGAERDAAVRKLADAIFDAEDALRADPVVNAILEAKAMLRDSVWFETSNHTFDRFGDWRVDECLIEELAEEISCLVEGLPKP